MTSFRQLARDVDGQFGETGSVPTTNDQPDCRRTDRDDPTPAARSATPPPRAAGRRTRSWAWRSALLPIPADRRPRRFVQLFGGLALYGVTIALLVRGALGASPWDVFHQGVATVLPFSLGTVVVIVGALVLLAWIPLRQRPGLGTVANVFVVGLAADATLALVPAELGLGLRITLMIVGVVGNALAGALYIGAGLGPGPRDGLMTGLTARTGRSVRVIRTIIEVSVLAVGFLLGGVAGIGTLLYAFGVGPLLHIFLPRLVVGPSPGHPAAAPTNPD